MRHIETFFADEKSTKFILNKKQLTEASRFTRNSQSVTVTDSPPKHDTPHDLLFRFLFAE